MWGKTTQFCLEVVQMIMVRGNLSPDKAEVDTIGMKKNISA